MSEGLYTSNKPELAERIRDIAGCVSVTELWCEEAQKLIYDLRDELTRTRLPHRSSPHAPYCDEATDGGHSSSHGLDSR